MTTTFLLVLAVIELPHLGMVSPLMLIDVAAIGTVVANRASAEPFIDPVQVVNVRFALSNLCGPAASRGQGLLLLSLSLLLQGHLGASATASGLVLVPVAAGTVVFSAISGRLVARIGVVPPLGAGGIAVTVAGALLLVDDVTTTPPATGCPAITLAGLVFGAGFGLANAPITATAVVGMGRQTGTAGGVVATSRQLGVSLGVAVAAAVSAPTAGIVTPSWITLIGCGAVITISALALAGRRAAGGHPPPIGSR